MEVTDGGGCTWTEGDYEGDGIVVRETGEIRLDGAGSAMDMECPDPPGAGGVRVALVGGLVEITRGGAFNFTAPTGSDVTIALADTAILRADGAGSQASFTNVDLDIDGSLEVLTGGAMTQTGGTLDVATAVTLSGEISLINVGSAAFAAGLQIEEPGRFTGDVVGDLLVPPGQPTLVAGLMVLREVTSASFADLTVSGRLRLQGGTALTAANYTQTATGLLGVQLDAATGGFDTMVMTGTGALGGGLRIDTNGAPLVVGSNFLLLTAAGGRSGQFDWIGTVQPVGLAVQATYTPTDVQISFVTPNEVDYSGDGNLSEILTGTIDDVSLTPDGADATVDVDVDSTVFGLDIQGINPTMTVRIGAGLRLSATEGVTVGVGGILTTQGGGGTLYTPLLAVQGGQVGGNLTAVGTVTSTGGTVSPGLSAGRITIQGNLTLDAASTLGVELGGTDNSDPMNLQYDEVEVTGTATLDGTLNVSLIAPYVPLPGDEFEIMTFGARIGAFAAAVGTENVGGYAGLWLELAYEADSLTLVAGALDGDTDLDADVDFDDFSTLAFNFGGAGTWPDGDFDGDGDVDFDDFSALAFNFGTTHAVAAVPEPAAVVLLAFGGAALLRRKRRG
jgi:hypothetical protein